MLAACCLVVWGPLTVGNPGGGYGAAVALNAAGDVFVTGSLYSGTSFDYAVVTGRSAP